MSAMYFRPVVTYPTRCVAPAFFARPAPVAHHIVPLFSLLDESLTQLDNHLRQAQRQFKRPFNPKFDVKETKGAYSLEGELPGFDAKDISIEFLDDGHTLQIKGKSVKEVNKGDAPAVKAVADAPTTAETSAEKTEASTSETSSLKSHQPTVEDDVEEPANASATETTKEQAVTETPKAAEQPQQTTQQPNKAEEQQRQQQSETTNWISERYTGSFTRSFKFPGKIDQEAVRASLKDGILAVTLPLARKPESRKIQIE